MRNIEAVNKIASEIKKKNKTRNKKNNIALKTYLSRKNNFNRLPYNVIFYEKIVSEIDFKIFKSIKKKTDQKCTIS